MKYISLFLILSAICLHANSQTYGKRYDLSFETDDRCGWGWLGLAYSTESSPDKEITLNGKHPVKFYHKIWERVKQTDTMIFTLCKIIPLPSYRKGETCSISLNSKSEGLEKFFLIVTCFDEYENATFADSISLNGRDWESNTVAFKLTKEKIIRININYHGDNNPKQAVWLDKITIKVNGRDIADYDIYDLDEQSKEKLKKGIDKKYLIPLSNNDDSLVPILEMVKDKKIIGLGECTHGSQEIKYSIYQFARTMVKKGDIKLFMVERPVDLMLKYDLFVQGYTTDEYIHLLKEDAQCYFDDYESFIDFLIWLRKYNSSSTSKVHLLGFDRIMSPRLALYQYHLAILGDSASLPYLKLIKSKQYKELSKILDSGTSFRDKTGEECFKFYMYLLESCDTPQINPANNSDVRDIEMAKRIQKATDIFVKNGEKVILHAHAWHIDRTVSIEGYPPKNIKAGCLLNEWYGSMYFPVSFQIGEGKYTDDECRKVGGNTSVSLSAPLPQSFEWIALNSGFDYFYYPAKQLGRDIIFAKNIARESRLREKERFLSLSKHYDAYVFVRLSSPLKNIQPLPAFYMSGYIERSTKKLNGVLN